MELLAVNRTNRRNLSRRDAIRKVKILRSYITNLAKTLEPRRNLLDLFLLSQRSSIIYHVTSFLFLSYINEISTVFFHT